MITIFEPKRTSLAITEVNPITESVAKNFFNVRKYKNRFFIPREANGYFIELMIKTKYQFRVCTEL